jgi:uncharacterized protein YbjT (DUF2867 family)
VRNSGAELTIVRSTWFAQNFSEGGFLDFVLAGEVTLPAGDTPEPFVDVDDIADVAVSALTEEGHVGKLYEVTGPRLLTFEEAVDEIAQAADRDIRYVPVSMAEFESLLVEQEVPADFVWLLKYLFTEVLDGRKRPPGGRRAACARAGAERFRRLRSGPRRRGRLERV